MAIKREFASTARRASNADGGHRDANDGFCKRHDFEGIRDAGPSNRRYIGANVVHNEDVFLMGVNAERILARPTSLQGQAVAIDDAGGNLKPRSPVRGQSMDQGLRDLRRSYLAAADGERGRITDVYFDDAQWGIRYLVVDTRWFGGRRMLVSSARVNGAHNRMSHVSAEGSDLEEDEDLCSAREIAGYRVNGPDGALGWVADLLFDLHRWSVSYLVISRRRWWLQEPVLIRPSLIRRIDWFHQSLEVPLGRRDVGCCDQRVRFR